MIDNERAHNTFSNLSFFAIMLFCMYFLIMYLNFTCSVYQWQMHTIMFELKIHVELDIVTEKNNNIYTGYSIHFNKYNNCTCDEYSKILICPHVFVVQSGPYLLLICYKILCMILMITCPYTRNVGIRNVENEFLLKWNCLICLLQDEPRQIITANIWLRWVSELQWFAVIFKVK